MYCASRNRLVNAATFMMANFNRISQTNHAPILVGGLVTMIANAIGMRQPLLRLHPLGKFRPMDIRFRFNIGIIRSLAPSEF